ncbi:hypothetical protein [Trinickia fusca]|uniref:Uncharacterized protein n=1 Tax=Trinickia fusca TaxID=2419777 RepID=A0A494X8N8_9BURK|nr:hypothetical protein [Trinickia fusca]RKP46820.1 hypothetical protein D7S89_15760 [Trinickia fusca]
MFKKETQRPAPVKQPASTSQAPPVQTTPTAASGPGLVEMGKYRYAGGVPPRHTPSSGMPSAREPSAASEPPQARDYTLYRADTRTYEQMQTGFPEGFTAWTPIGVSGAQQLANVFLGSKDTSGLPRHVSDKVGEWPNPKLADLSTYIKYTKDKSTVWVSTAINTEAGGQSSGAPLYKISARFYEFEIQNRQLVPLPNGRTSNLKPSLLLDAPMLEASTIVALNHGPLRDAEVSFLTPIPLSIVEPYHP